MLNPQPGARLEVWGDPVAHSRSPQLHTAAYGVLGLDWAYERRRVAAGGFASELAGLADRWRGLSLTMPLKSVAFAAATVRDRRAQLTGAVNTLLLTPEGRLGFNTDVGGLARDLDAWGMRDVDHARIVGAGATATSALVALAEIGVTSVEVVARRVETIAPLERLGTRLGVTVRGVPMTAGPYRSVPLTVATLPGDAPVADEIADALASSGGGLYDVVYGRWPTDLAAAWDPDQPTWSGLGMLLHQALLQVRIFVTGDADQPLPDEDAVLTAMRAVLVGD